VFPSTLKPTEIPMLTQEPLAILLVQYKPLMPMLTLAY
jgi:hypothetical protein